MKRTWAVRDSSRVPINPYQSHTRPPADKVRKYVSEAVSVSLSSSGVCNKIFISQNAMRLAEYIPRRASRDLRKSRQQTINHDTRHSSHLLIHLIPLHSLVFRHAAERQHRRNVKQYFPVQPKSNINPSINNLQHRPTNNAKKKLTKSSSFPSHTPSHPNAH